MFSLDKLRGMLTDSGNDVSANVDDGNHWNTGDEIKNNLPETKATKSTGSFPDDTAMPPGTETYPSKLPRLKASGAEKGNWLPIVTDDKRSTAKKSIPATPSNASKDTAGLDHSEHSMSSLAAMHRPLAKNTIQAQAEVKKQQDALRAIIAQSEETMIALADEENEQQEQLQRRRMETSEAKRKDKSTLPEFEAKPGDWQSVVDEDLQAKAKQLIMERKLSQQKGSSHSYDSDESSVSKKANRPKSKEALKLEEMMRKQQELVAAAISGAVDASDALDDSDLMSAHGRNYVKRNPKDWHNLVNGPREMRREEQIDENEGDDDDNLDGIRPKTKQERKLEEIAQKQRDQVQSTIKQAPDANEALMDHAIPSKSNRMQATVTKQDWHDVGNGLGRPKPFVGIHSFAGNDGEDGEIRPRTKEERKLREKVRKQKEQIRSTMQNAPDAGTALFEPNELGREEGDMTSSEKAEHDWQDIGSSVGGKRHHMENIISDGDGQEDEEKKNRPKTRQEEMLVETVQLQRELVHSTIMAAPDAERALNVSNISKYEIGKDGKKAGGWHSIGIGMGNENHSLTTGMDADGLVAKEMKMNAMKQRQQAQSTITESKYTKRNTTDESVPYNTKNLVTGLSEDEWIDAVGTSPRTIDAPGATRSHRLDVTDIRAYEQQARTLSNPGITEIGQDHDQVKQRHAKALDHVWHDLGDVASAMHAKRLETNQKYTQRHDFQPTPAQRDAAVNGSDVPVNRNQSDPASEANNENNFANFSAGFDPSSYPYNDKGTYRQNDPPMAAQGDAAVNGSDVPVNRNQSDPASVVNNENNFANFSAGFDPSSYPYNDKGTYKVVDSTTTVVLNESAGVRGSESREPLHSEQGSQTGSNWHGLNPGLFRNAERGTYDKPSTRLMGTQARSEKHETGDEGQNLNLRKAENVSSKQSKKQQRKKGKKNQVDASNSKKQSKREKANDDGGLQSTRTVNSAEVSNLQIEAEIPSLKKSTKTQEVDGPNSIEKSANDEELYANPFSVRPGQFSQAAMRSRTKSEDIEHLEDSPDDMTTLSEDGHLARQPSKRTLLRRKVDDRRQALTNMLNATREHTWGTENDLLDLKRKLTISQALVQKLEVENSQLLKKPVLEVARAQLALLEQRDNREKELEKTIQKLMDERNAAVMESHELRILVMGSCDKCRERFEHNRQYAMDTSIRNTILEKQRILKSSAFEWFSGLTGGVDNIKVGVQDVEELRTAKGDMAPGMPMNINIMQNNTLLQSTPMFSKASVEWLAEKLFSKQLSGTDGNYPRTDQQLSGMQNQSVVEPSATDTSSASINPESSNDEASGEANGVEPIQDPHIQGVNLIQKAPSTEKQPSFLNTILGDHTNPESSFPSTSDLVSAAKLANAAKLALGGAGDNSNTLSMFDSRLKQEEVQDDMEIFNNLLKSQAMQAPPPKPVIQPELPIKLEHLLPSNPLSLPNVGFSLGLEQEKFDDIAYDKSILNALKESQAPPLLDPQASKKTKSPSFFFGLPRSRLGQEQFDDEARDKSILETSKKSPRSASKQAVVDEKKKFRSGALRSRLGDEQFDGDARDENLLKGRSNAFDSTSTQSKDEKKESIQKEGDRMANQSSKGQLSSPEDAKSKADDSSDTLKAVGTLSASKPKSFLSRKSQRKPRISMMNHVPMDVEIEGERAWRKDTGNWRKPGKPNSFALPTIEGVDESENFSEEEKQDASAHQSDDEDLDHIAQLLALEGN